MSEAERKKLMGFMEEHFPRMVIELERLREESPERFERRMQRIGPEMRRLMATMETDPAKGMVLIRERQIGLRMQQVVRKYHQASSEEQDDLRREMRELAGQELETRLQRRAMEVRQLETRLAELKDRLAQMESVKDEIIERRARELLERKPPRQEPLDNDAAPPPDEPGPDKD